MDSTDSSSGSQHPQLPPGFRFHPTDEELVVHYLKRKVASAPLPVAIIADVNLYKFDPWELPSKATFGDQEWYFFSPRDRKYPSGARPNRAATSGYWKATGTDKPILSSEGNQKVGVKKALVFYSGKPPKGVKTNWIMHEYRLGENPAKSNSKPLLVADAAGHNNNKKNSLRLDDWVLCRIYKKHYTSSLHRPLLMEQDKELSKEAVPPLMSTLSMANTFQNSGSSRIISYGPLGIENDDNFFDGILAADQSMQNVSDHSHHFAQQINSKGSFPSKRALPSQFWNGTGSSNSASKRFHADVNNGGNTTEENISFVSLLSQFPQSTTFHPNALLGTLGDGVLRKQFRLPSINWNS